MFEYMTAQEAAQKWNHERELLLAEVENYI